MNTRPKCGTKAKPGSAYIRVWRIWFGVFGCCRCLDVPLFFWFCVAFVAFVAHSRRIHHNFASCVCLYFVHCTSSDNVILVLVIDTFGTAAACLLVER